MRSKKALKNMIFSIIHQIVNIVCGFIVPKLIISHFGSSINGLTSSIAQFLGYITLLESGFGPVIKSTLYKPIAQKDKKQIANILKTSEQFFKRIAYIFLIYIIILFFAYPTIINNEFSFIFTASLILIISVSTFAEYFFGITYRLFINANQENYVVSIIRILTRIANTVMIIILVRYYHSIHLIKLLSATIFVLRPIAQNIYVKRKYKIDLSIADKDYKIPNKWDGLAQHIAAVIHSNTDITVLTLLSNLLEVSVYSVYYLVVNGIKKIITALTGGIDASFGDMIAKNEIKNLNIKFRYYELFYYLIITIIYSCTFILIVPFIKIYMSGVTDVNYIRPLFAFLLVLAEFVCAIRQPYISITYAAGKFKETMKGAWVEAILNIVISVCLVFKFGLIGVAIGTLVAMLIRTIEFILYSSKNILHRSVFEVIKRNIIMASALLITYLFGSIFLKYYEINNYFNFIIAGLVIVSIAFVISIILNYIFYKQDFGGIKIMLKRITKGKSKVSEEV